MDDALEVRVLQRLARLDEERKAVPDREPPRVAELGDRLALDILHREKRAPLRREPAVEHPCDVRVVHHRKRLALLLEARDDASRVHARLDELERHALHIGLAPLGEPHFSEAAFADLRDQLECADQIARAVEPVAVVAETWGALAPEGFREIVRRICPG